MTRNRLLLFCLGLLIIFLIRFIFFYQNQQAIVLGKEVQLSGQIVSEPKFNNNFQNYQVKSSLGIRIYITDLQEKEYLVGDNVRLIGRLEKRVLSNNREIYTMFLPQVSVVKNSLGPFLAVTNFVRQQITDFYNYNLSSNSASLLLGIVFGVKGNLSEDFLLNLRSAGVMHVIAASGMNVTLIGGFLSSFLVLFFKRQWAIVLTILGLIFYAFLAGFGASIVRATIMGILVFTSQILGRQYLASYGLFLAGFLMLLISPDLLFDIGFQISFMATVGLLYVRPVIDALMFNKTTKKISIIEDLTTTIAAQLTTIPILFVNFGSYSIWSIVANALILWTIPILMILGGIGAILSFILTPLAQFFVYLCIPLLWYFENVIKLFPIITTNSAFIDTSWQIIIGYYLILIAIVLWLGIRNSKHENKNI